MSKDPAIGGPGAVVERGGVSIPKLDFSVIYMQRDQPSDAEQEGESQDGGGADQHGAQNQSSFFKQNKSA